MRILFVTSSYAIGDFKGGGISTYATEVVGCYSNEHEISVIICNDKQCEVDIPGVKTYHISPFDASFTSAKKLISIIEEEEPEIIINSNVDLLSLVLPYISNDIKVISICHSLGSLETETAGFNNEYADMIVALSGNAKNHILRRFKMSTDKITVIPNFVADLDGSSNLLARKKNDTILNIVFTGGGTGTKSPDLIAKVLKKLLKTELDFKFWWIGGTLPPLHGFSLFKDIRKLIPSDNRVVFTGFVPYTEAQRLTSEANVFLLPSRREGCPISLLEAMRAGAIPIVAEYKISNREIIRDGYNGFVINHRNVNRYVEVIIDMIKNNQEKGFLYDNSYSYFRDNLSYKVWENKMNDLLDVQSAHRKRNKTTDERDFIRDKRKLDCFLKLRRLQTFSKESLPAYISMNWQYVLNHY